MTVRQCAIQAFGVNARFQNPYVLITAGSNLAINIIIEKSTRKRYEDYGRWEPWISRRRGGDIARLAKGLNKYDYRMIAVDL
jgi:hypothetical protein